MASPTTPSQSHRLPCTAAEASRAACLNGGACFAWESGAGTRSIGCSCTSQWDGDRCQYMYMDPEDWGLSEASPFIALAVVIPLVVIFAVVTLVVFFCIKRKRRDQRRLQLQKPAVSENIYETTTSQQLQRPAVSPQNGQLKVRYDSPDMTGSTQLSESQRYSSNSNPTVSSDQQVYWESAV